MTLKRSAPLARTPMKRAPPKPPAARTERVITPRCTALRVSGPHGKATSVRMADAPIRPQLKDGAHRSEQWLRNVATESVQIT